MRGNWISIGCSALVAVLMLGGCGGGGEQEGSPAEEAVEVTQESPETATAMEPDTTGTGLWAYLEAQEYAANWQLWPGKEKFYTGTEPHGAVLSTYVNDIALAAIEGDATSLPTGSIVVKENYTPDTTMAAVTVMYKMEGYNPDHGDWFWLKRTAQGEVEAEGRVGPCIECHGSKADNDYLFTTPLN